MPRSIYVDLEPSVVDEVRTGTYKCADIPCTFALPKDSLLIEFAKVALPPGEDRKSVV